MKTVPRTVPYQILWTTSCAGSWLRPGFDVFFPPVEEIIPGKDDNHYSSLLDIHF